MNQVQNTPLLQSSSSISSSFPKNTNNNPTSNPFLQQPNYIKGSNSSVIGSFIIYKALSFFASHFEIKVQQRQATSFLMGEINALQTKQVLDKVPQDYDMMYVMYDIFHSIGVIHRVNQNGLLYMRWNGYKGFKAQFSRILSENQAYYQHQQQSAIGGTGSGSGGKAQMKKMMMMMMNSGNKMSNVKRSITDELASHMLYSLYKSKEMTTLKYKQQSAKILFDDCNAKQTDVREKIRKMFIKILIILRVISKQRQVSDEMLKTIKAGSRQFNKHLCQDKILKWEIGDVQNQNRFDEFDQEQTLKELLEVRELLISLKFNQKTIIMFKRQPLKTTSQSFNAKSSFAMLRGRDWHYYVKNFVTIIGKSSKQPQKFFWHVDVDIGHVDNVSRQHAVILYNFDRRLFELKVLSDKYPVYINGDKYFFDSEPFPLKDRDRITIGVKQSFYFLLPGLDSCVQQ